jgi:hypothetical protein
MLTPIEIDDLATRGVILDEPAYQLPPEAWSTGTNIRAFADGLESLQGLTGTLGGNPRQLVSTFSLSFNGTSQYLTATGKTGINQQKFTFACWFKRATIGSGQALLYFGDETTSNRVIINFNTSNNIKIEADIASSVIGELITSAAYTDMSSWHHLCIAVDTTQATAANRLVMWVDGTKVTSFSTSTYPSQNTNLSNNYASTYGIGLQTLSPTPNAYFSGKLAQVYYVDGQYLTPTDFISGTPGVAIPFAGTYSGTFDFALLFANNSSTVTLGIDSSGESNNWTLNGMTTANATSDIPTGPLPQFVMYVSSPGQPWWLWTSLTDIFVFDGSKDTRITRSAGPYGATDAKDIYGTILGGVPIIGTREDIPQYWNSYSDGQLMQNLPNWPSGLTARVVRTFAPYLLAMNTTLSGANTPHRIWWSSSASPGSLPSTWDYTDPTHDAGINDLPDVSSGFIVDGQELQGQFFIYKENATWRVQFIGGQFIFSFQSFLETAGALCTRAVATTGDGLRHCFASQDDIVIHNGYLAESVLNKRMKRYLFNLIDTQHYDTSFMFCNPLYEEMWFCFPTQGSSEPNHAIIWNYRYNTLSEADSTMVNFVATSIGTVLTASNQTWQNATISWLADPNPWATAQRRKTVVCNPTSGKLLALDVGTTNDGAPINSVLQRTGMGVIGRKRSGEWLEDFETRKLVSRVWPKLSIGSCNVRVGYQALPNGAVSWTPYQPFSPATQAYVDGCLGSGRSSAVEFSGTNFFHLDGYKIDLATLGHF